MSVDWQSLLNTAFIGLAAVVGWVGRTFYTDIRELEKSIAAHRVEVARDYATNSDIREINTKLDDILKYLRK